MREWKIKRVTAWNDKILADKITEIESDSSCKVKSIILINNNPQNRTYQIIYTKE